MSTLAAPPKLGITAADRRRILGALFVARGGIGVGYLAGFIVITIAAKEITGHAELAGLPAAVSMVGRAIGPPPIARAMDVFGRRPAIAGSYALGAVGALTCALAIAAGWFWLLLVASLLVGVARTGGDMSRYVAAEIYPASRPRSRHRDCRLGRHRRGIGRAAAGWIYTGSGELGRAVALCRTLAGRGVHACVRRSSDLGLRAT